MIFSSRARGVFVPACAGYPRIATLSSAQQALPAKKRLLMSDAQFFDAEVIGAEDIVTL
jgi:hypothetical protein